MNQETFSLALAFDRDDPTFARGVEIGMVWQRLQHEPLPMTAVMHAENAEMALRLADAIGASARAESHGSDWMAVTFS